MPHSFCLFVANFGGLMAAPTVLPYCLVYPIKFWKDTPQDEKNHLHPNKVFPGLHTRECVCSRTIHCANTMSDHYTIYVGGHLLVPWGAQYSNEGLPKVTKSCNHHGSLINPKSKEAYPMYDVGNFTLDDTLSGDAWGQLHVWR